MSIAVPRERGFTFTSGRKTIHDLLVAPHDGERVKRIE